MAFAVDVAHARPRMMRANIIQNKVHPKIMSLILPSEDGFHQGGIQLGIAPRFTYFEGA